MEEYVVSVYTSAGIERIMSVAKGAEEAARIAENLRNGGYTEINIRKVGEHRPGRIM